MKPNFEKHRRDDGSIDLIAVYEEAAENERIQHWREAEYFLSNIEEIHRISSRQAAAVAIATAIQIGRGIES